MSKTVLEIAVFSLESAILASGAGADRIEFCENPQDGGTTPSFGSLKMGVDLIKIPIFPIIRCRGGDFLYAEYEYRIMLEDMLLCKKLGFEGVVAGFLNRDGSVDKKMTSEFVSLAYPMEVTFHRAFDRAANPFEALETIIGCGCSRILTSGQFPTATEGKDLLKELVRQSDDRIIILPGSGIRSSNIISVLEETGASEIHSSARTQVPSEMTFINGQMQEENRNISVDAQEIKRMKDLLIEKDKNQSDTKL